MRAETGGMMRHVERKVSLHIELRGLGLHVQPFHASAREEERDEGGKLQEDDGTGKSSEVQDRTTNDKNNTYNESNLGLLVRIGCFTKCRLGSELARLH